MGNPGFYWMRKKKPKVQRDPLASTRSLPKAAKSVSRETQSGIKETYHEVN